MKRLKEIRKTTKKNFLKIKNNEQEIEIVQEETESFETYNFEETSKKEKRNWIIRPDMLIQFLVQIIKGLF